MIPGQGSARHSLSATPPDTARCATPGHPGSQWSVVPGLLPVVIDRLLAIDRFLASNWIAPHAARLCTWLALVSSAACVGVFRHLSVQGVRYLPCRVASLRARNGL